MTSTLHTEPARLQAPGLLLGIGVGGFFDGIVLHQVLQWHHMLSSTGEDRLGLDPVPVDTVAGLETNTLWDGLFHVTALVFVLAGLAVLARRGTLRPLQLASSGQLWGWVLAGWGVFNLVEGIVNHHLLGVHHVRAGSNELAYDLGFLAVGALFVVAGTLIARRSAR